MPASTHHQLSRRGFCLCCLGATAVVFLIPGFVSNGEQPSETIADVWSGRCPAERIRPRDPELMSWVEIEAAAASGRVDFQAHTLYHHRVPVTGRIVADLLVRGRTDVPVTVEAFSPERFAFLA